MTVLVLALVVVPAASAHVLTVDRAERAAERYAEAEASTSGQAQITVDAPTGGVSNVSVESIDSAPCRRRNDHRRSCRVSYLGQDYLEPSCRLGPLTVDAKVEECFSRVRCSQQVTVTLTGTHRTRRRSRTRGRTVRRSAHIETRRFGSLVVTGADIGSCERASDPSR